MKTRTSPDLLLHPEDCQLYTALWTTTAKSTKY